MAAIFSASCAAAAARSVRMLRVSRAISERLALSSCQDAWPARSASSSSRGVRLPRLLLIPSIRAWYASASSVGRTSFPVAPCLTAFKRDFCLPISDRGPVDFSELALTCFRLAFSVRCSYALRYLDVLCGLKWFVTVPGFTPCPGVHTPGYTMSPLSGGSETYEGPAH